MRIFRACALLIALASTVMLGGCAGEIAKIQTTFSNVVSSIGSVKVKSKTAYIAINVFNGAEKAVIPYLRLPMCNGSGNLCRVNGAAEALDKPFCDAMNARNSLRAWMEANPGTVADAGLYNTLVAATNALQKVMADYGIGTPGGSK